MKVSLNWLREYVDIDIDVKEYADKMTMTGTKAETIELVGHGIENVVIGKIMEILPHPDAEKLVITKINIGKEDLLQIVTGANNIMVGDVVPVALEGAKLPGGISIKKGKLRGVDSFGMLCSTDELGINKNLANERSQNGIYILDSSLELGSNAIDILNVKDEIIEFEITANRPDCRSMMGIVKETAATLDKKYRLPKTDVKGTIEDKVNISIDNQSDNLCKRFIVKEIRNIKVGKSPEYIQKRLLSYGIRPINNIVDITNYVMAEMGQPLHAYDKDKFNSDKIIIRKANNKEKIYTLDKNEYELDSETLVIATDKKAVGIAGIMGGFDTQVDDGTKSIYLECANFEADSIRLSSRRLGIRTDASSMFEKGIDLNRAEIAINRACYLIEELGIGEVVKVTIDTLDKKLQKTEIVTTFSAIDNILGAGISKDVIVDILNKLDFYVECSEDDLKVVVPFERMDMSIKEDIVEEIARIYGYNNIESKSIEGLATQSKKSKERIFADKIKKLARENGLTEIATYSFISPKAIEKANLDNGSSSNLFKLLNPLGEETSVMRTTLIPSMLEIVSNNLAKKNNEFFAFEYGNTFFNVNDVLPLEKDSFVAGIYGNNEDFFTAKARLEGILISLGVKNAEYIKQRENSTYHSGRCADVLYKGQKIATIGEVNPLVCENFKIKKRVYLFEIFVSELMEVSDEKIVYNPIPKFPSIEKDIAVVVSKDKTVGDIQKIISKYGKKNLESIKLFDIYEGEQVDSNKKSLAFKLVFRANDRTLTDEEVMKIFEKIIKQLEIEVEATLR